VPRHGDNSRAIDLPRLRLTPSGEGSAGSGRALVRAEFGEQGGAPVVTVIDTLGSVAPDLASRLRGSLALDFTSDERHRTVAFAVVEVGESPAIRDSIVFLPRCCCGSHFCI
jgi:hypothetical protein